jgi:hypothetical protein
MDQGAAVWTNKSTNVEAGDAQHPNRKDRCDGASSVSAPQNQTAIEEQGNPSNSSNTAAPPSPPAPPPSSPARFFDQLISSSKPSTPRGGIRALNVAAGREVGPTCASEEANDRYGIGLWLMMCNADHTLFLILGHILDHHHCLSDLAARRRD